MLIIFFICRHCATNEDGLRRSISPENSAYATPLSRIFFGCQLPHFRSAGLSFDAPAPNLAFSVPFCLAARFSLRSRTFHAVFFSPLGKKRCVAARPVLIPASFQNNNPAGYNGSCRGVHIVDGSAGRGGGKMQAAGSYRLIIEMEHLHPFSPDSSSPSTLCTPSISLRTTSSTIVMRSQIEVRRTVLFPEKRVCTSSTAPSGSLPAFFCIFLRAFLGGLRRDLSEIPPLSRLHFRHLQRPCQGRCPRFSHLL